ncbi:MAG: carboxypeptidase regulatory-like domain-containing protein [Flammeovirgaceae bacterium]|nr:carboxypeptidase regulatory-like domain-containing protein [Flammeovirgaceae bacterium]
MIKFNCILFLLITVNTYAQQITQTVTGSVRDVITGSQLSGANISVFEKENLVRGVSSNELGKFSLTLAPGRYRVQVSFTGYLSGEQELLVIAGKSSLLDVALQELPTVLDEVMISPEAFSVAGVTSLSVEKTLRVPANFFDPVRMLTSYPGVIATNDQANSISVKGYSPNGILWRLQGLDIVNLIIRLMPVRLATSQP